jgi:hypothetical protein
MAAGHKRIRCSETPTLIESVAKSQPRESCSRSMDDLAVLRQFDLTNVMGLHSATVNPHKF